MNARAALRGPVQILQDLLGDQHVTHLGESPVVSILAAVALPPLTLPLVLTPPSGDGVHDERPDDDHHDGHERSNHRMIGDISSSAGRIPAEFDLNRANWGRGATRIVISFRQPADARSPPPSHITRLTRENSGTTMTAMVRRWRMFLGVLAMVGVFTSGFAACVNAADDAMQMACCKAGHDHCPMKDSASDCCKLSGQPESQATIVKAKSIRAPVSVLLTSALLPAAAIADVQHGRGSYESSPPRVSNGPPSSIAFSVLLI